MRLAVILPHRNRDPFKEFLESYLPAYLSSRRIEHKLFFCEQRDEMVFSLSRCVNAAFKFCMDDFNPDYVVVNQIDMVPINVDYSWPGIAESWFLNAGGMRLLASEFAGVNGYNNRFVGWGYEDSELWGRLSFFGVENRLWESPPGTKMVDLEMGPCDSRLASLRYFGKDNPRFYHYAEVPFTRHLHFKPVKTWFSDEIKSRNYDLSERVSAMDPEERRRYYMENGLCEIDPGKIHVDSNSPGSADIHVDTADCFI